MVWMDVRESQQALRKHPKVDTPRPPLFTADKNNGTTRRPRTREISSRYRSPTPVPSPCPRRCPSPIVTRTATTTTTASVSKRAISVERKRLSTSPSPPSPSPSTPVEDSSTEILLASRKLAANRSESLWPSTMRSLSVSFQSDSFSLPVSSKGEKPVSHALADRTLKSSSNVAHKQNETPPVSRKPTPERKRSPLKGKNSVESENSKPVEGLRGRLVEQHRWPSRAGGKVSSNALNKSIDLTDKPSRIPSLTQSSGLGVPSLRRFSLDSNLKPLQKSASDLLSLVSSDEGSRQRIKVGKHKDDSMLMHKPVPSSLLERTKQVNSAVRSQSLLTSGSRPASPNRASVSSSSASRGVSPSRPKTANGVPSRVSSPSRTRPLSPSRQPNNATSVLSFIADIRKGKKAANHVEDAHQLRLLYNRHLQWRFANAQADAALHLQEVKAEKILYNVWRSTSDLWDLVIQKRIELQQLRLKVKLHLILNEQLAYLNEWASLEEDHTESLSRAIMDLEASTLRLPITEGARGDIQAVKSAVCSAVDVMQAMGSSVGFVLSEVGEMNCLVSELADVAALERAMLDECESLLASTAAMQIEEYSLRTNLVQLKEAWRTDQLILGN